MNEKDIRHCGVCLETDKAAKSFTFPETNYIKKKRQQSVILVATKAVSWGKIVV